MYQQRIRSFYDQLSPGYRRVADFLLNHYREAAFMTAAQVGRSSRVDTTSVVRFAQRIGYPGFPELIAEVQEDVKRDLRCVYEPAPEELDPAAVFRSSLIEDRNSLSYALLHIEPQQVLDIVRIIESAPRLFVIGEGAASSAAEVFFLRLQSLGYNARLVPADLPGRTALTVWMKRGDAIIGIGSLLGTPGVASTLRVARDEGVHTIAIVGDPASRAASMAEHVLYAPAHPGKLLSSLTVLHAMLNGLIQALTVDMGQRAEEWAERAQYLSERYAQVALEPTASVPGADGGTAAGGVEAPAEAMAAGPASPPTTSSATI